MVRVGTEVKGGVCDSNPMHVFCQIQQKSPRGLLAVCSAADKSGVHPQPAGSVNGASVVIPQSHVCRPSPLKQRRFVARLWALRIASPAVPICSPERNAAFEAALSA